MAFDEVMINNPKLVSLALFGAGFVAASILFKYRQSGARAVMQAARSNSNSAKGDNNSDGNLVSKEYKMVLVVRSDLGMSKGKVAAQCAHAAVGAVEKLAYENMAALRQWQKFGQTKVVLKVDNEKSLFDLVKSARSKNIPTCLVSDAGRTQIAPGSKTVLAVGPGPLDEVDQITGHLKLL